MAAKIIMLIMCALITEYTSAVAVCKDKFNSFSGGYEYYDNIGYYKLYTTPTNWGNAWRQCKNDGGHLLVFNSVEEHEAILELMRGAADLAFIGVHGFFLKGHYSTVTGEDLVASSYNKWGEGEPGGNPYDGLKCVKINNGGRLFLSECSAQCYYICEVELSSNHTSSVQQ